MAGPLFILFVHLANRVLCVWYVGRGKTMSGSRIVPMQVSVSRCLVIALVMLVQSVGKYMWPSTQPHSSCVYRCICVCLPVFFLPVCVYLTSMYIHVCIMATAGRMNGFAELEKIAVSMGAGD